MWFREFSIPDFFGTDCFDETKTNEQRDEARSELFKTLEYEFRETMW